MLLLNRNQLLALFLTIAAIALTGPVLAAPGDILFSDDFNRPNLAPWTTTNATASGILNGGQTSGSNPRGAFTRNTAVTVTSPSINAAVPAARVEIWIRRGADSIPNSEDTDANENFVVEYLSSGGGWNQLATYLGSGTNGQIYNASFVLPADGLHGSLAIRVRQTQGSGFDFDYWHFDDVIVTEMAVAGPLDVGVCDYFENGLGSNWTVNTGSGLGGISAATALSPTNSLFLNGGTVSVESSVVDTTDPTFSGVSMWIRRGADSFSEDPDGGEDLVVEFLDDTNSWVALGTFSGSGGPGQQFTPTYAIPASGQHAGFRLRFRMTGGSGPTWDFWHVDDVCFDQNPDPIMQVAKLQMPLSDPINGTSSPRAIPGAIVQYTVSVTNQGIGSVDAGTLEVTDVVPPNTALFVSTASGDPVSFVDGSPSSGLTYVYASHVSYSDNPGGVGPFDYTPTPDAQGFDPLVTGFQVIPAGSMLGDSGTGPTSFNIVFRVRIE